MKWELASKKQLLTICLYEECPQSYINGALRELRIRERSKKKIMEMYNTGLDTWLIAEETGINHRSVCSTIYGLKRRMEK